MPDMGILRTLLAPRKTLFGAGAVDKVADEAKQLGGKKILLVTDETVMKLKIVDKVRGPLTSEGFEVDIWDKVEPEPTMPVAETLTKFARKKQYNSVVGVGGGSSLDMAKVAALMPNNPGDFKDYVGGVPLTSRGIPLLAIPTTSGTGSEATATLVVTNKEMKTGITHPYIMPDMALIDPALTLSLPQKVTANTGMDALSHAIEAYMSQKNNSFADAVALQSMRLIADNLRLAYSQGGNLEARVNMSMASMLGGLSIANSSTCGGHALAYGFAVMKQLPHGFSCATALPFIMEYNLLAIPERLADVAEALGEDTSGMHPREAAYTAVNAVARLNNDLGIPLSLEELDIKHDEIPLMADETMKIGRLLSVNPRSMNRDEAVGIFERMWHGFE
jgi:alcohol dehydrogenase class IV